MDKTTILEQETKMEEGVLVVKRLVEERLSRHDLELEAENCRRQMQQVIVQSQQLKKQHDALVSKLTVVGLLLEEFPEEGFMPI